MNSEWLSKLFIHDTLVRNNAFLEQQIDKWLVFTNKIQSVVLTETLRFHLWHPALYMKRLDSCKETSDLHSEKRFTDLKSRVFFGRTYLCSCSLITIKLENRPNLCVFRFFWISFCGHLFTFGKAEVKQSAHKMAGIKARLAIIWQLRHAICKFHIVVAWKSFLVQKATTY